MTSSLVYTSNGHWAIDCPRCKQVVRVDRHRDRFRFKCYGGCTDAELTSALDPALMLELVTATGQQKGTGASTLVDFAEIVAKPVRWAWQDRVALAKITALAGRPKIGKGLLYSHLLARVTHGDLEGNLDGPRNSIIVTTEDDPGDTLKPRVMAAGADLGRVSIFQMGSRDEPVPFRVPQDAAELSRRVAEKEAALVVVDPLMEFIDGKVDSHKSHPVRQAIAALNQIARETGCAVLVIFHLNKGASTDPLLRHEGSAAFTQVVRGGLILGHDPGDPDGEDGNQRVLAVSSSNLAALAPSLVYRIDAAHVDGDTGEEISTAKMVCIGESAAGAHDLLRGAPGAEEQTATGEAEHFLREELADGPRPAGEIEAEARKIGIAKTTLFRARKTLEIKPERVSEKGAGRGSGVWQWSLPPVQDSNPEDEARDLERWNLEQTRLQSGLVGSTDVQGSTPYMAESWSEKSSSEGCVCRTPARSPRANGQDVCQTCKQPISAQ